jgi:hypothetical protein
MTNVFRVDNPTMDPGYGALLRRSTPIFRAWTI